MSTVVDAPFDAYLDTPNKSIRQNVPRKGVVLHHAAMTSLSGLESLAMGGKQVSATAIAKDRISKRLMSDEFRAWSLSSAWGDSSFRSVETCNQSTDGWTISDESHWELAYLVAFWALVDGFWPHRDGDAKTWTVIGHREAYTIWDISYGTACPGGMLLDLVTYRAQQLILGTALHREHDMQYYISNSASKDGLIPNSAVYAQGADGVLRRVIAEEWNLINYWNANGRPTPTWEIPGNQIADLVRTVGLWEVKGGAGADQYRPTGRLIYELAQGAVWPSAPQVAGLDKMIADAVKAAVAANPPKVDSKLIADAVGSLVFKAETE